MARGRGHIGIKAETRIDSPLKSQIEAIRNGLPKTEDWYDEDGKVDPIIIEQVLSTGAVIEGQAQELYRRQYEGSLNEMEVALEKIEKQLRITGSNSEHYYGPVDKFEQAQDRVKFLEKDLKKKEPSERPNLAKELRVAQRELRKYQALADAKQKLLLQMNHIEEKAMLFCRLAALREVQDMGVDFHIMTPSEEDSREIKDQERIIRAIDQASQLFPSRWQETLEKYNTKVFPLWENIEGASGHYMPTSYGGYMGVSDFYENVDEPITEEFRWNQREEERLREDKKQSLTRTVRHEMGHHLEYNLSHIGFASVAYFDQRMAADKPFRSDYSNTSPDRMRGMSEVFSVGIEKLFSLESEQLDKEHQAFILGLFALA